MFNRFYSWYRRKFNELSETPPPEVWNGISEYLGKHPASYSNKAPVHGRFSRNLAFLSAALILLAVSGIAYFTNLTSNRLILLNFHPSLHNKSLIAIKPGETPVEEKSRYIASPANQAVKNNAVLNPIAVVYPVELALGKAGENAENVFNEGLSGFIPPSPKAKMFKSAIYGEESGNILSSAATPVSISHAIEKSRNAFRGLYFGSAAVISNSWLLNEDTYDGMKSASLNRTNFYISKTFFVTAGYNFTGHFGVQLEEIFNNKLGQNYTVFEHGHLVNKKTELNFFQINALAKFRNPVWAYQGKHPFYWNKIAGIHYGDLRSANKQADGENVSVFSDYRKKTYGITVGVECELPLSQNWVIASSLLGNFDFNNVYAGNRQVPTSSANSTYISSFCLNLGVNYFLPEKD